MGRLLCRQLLRTRTVPSRQTGRSNRVRGAYRSTFHLLNASAVEVVSLSEVVEMMLLSDAYSGGCRRSTIGPRTGIRPSRGSALGAPPTGGPPRLDHDGGRTAQVCGL